MGDFYSHAKKVSMVREPALQTESLHCWLSGSFRARELFPGMLSRSTPTLGKRLSLQVNSLA